MRTYAHIVNAVAAGRASDLMMAQPITFESMRVARAYCSAPQNVALLTAQFAEDRGVAPTDFTATPDLDRSILDLGTFARPRKLPLLRDILGRAVAHNDAEYVIYTNVDIALLPQFYVAVDRLIGAGWDALVINRRTIDDAHTAVEDLPVMQAKVGRKHPGHDCFVFRRAAFSEYELGEVCIGMAWVAKPLLLNMAYFAGRFRIFEDLHLTFHVGDPRPWQDPAFVDYRRHNRDEFYKSRDRLLRRLGPLQARLAAGSTLPPMHEDRPPWWTRAAKAVLPGAVYGVLKAVFRAVKPAKDVA